jgi:ferredoxin-NADP reductase
MTADNLRRLVPDVADRDVYLCASSRFAAAVRSALRAAGLPRGRLHEESFAF